MAVCFAEIRQGLLLDTIQQLLVLGLINERTAETLKSGPIADRGTAEDQCRPDCMQAAA